VGEHGHRGTRAVQSMVEFAPSTGGLALWMHHRDLPDEEALASRGADTAPVSTDGGTLFYTAAFTQRPAAEQVGLVAHGVLHVALRHAQRYVEMQHLLGDVDLALFNVCADAIVNSTLGHLAWLRLPAGAVTLERLLASALRVEQPVEKSLLEWDVESLYRAIDDRGPPQRGHRADPRSGSGDAQASSAKAGGQPAQAGTEAERPAARQDGARAAAARALGAKTPADLRPGPDTTAAPEVEAEQTREWSERITRAHAGDGEFSMLRALVADLPRTRTPWEQVLRAQLARGLMPRPALSWSRPARSYLANQGRAGPHRRMPWEPGFSGLKNVPRLAVMIDVSGSIDENLLARFAREIEAIARRLEAALVLVVGDDRVRHVTSFDPGRLQPGRLDLRRIEFQGGGGTDFTPLLEEADSHRPDIGVFLTDLEGPARMRPRWPVIWAVPEQSAAAVAPFGRKLGLR
jgi:predicted metal-dependent peptidase